MLNVKKKALRERDVDSESSMTSFGGALLKEVITRDKSGALNLLITEVQPLQTTNDRQTESVLPHSSVLSLAY